MESSSGINQNSTLKSMFVGAVPSWYMVSQMTLLPSKDIHISLVKCALSTLVCSHCTAGTLTSVGAEISDIKKPPADKSTLRKKQILISYDQ